MDNPPSSPNEGPLRVSFPSHQLFMDIPPSLLNERPDSLARKRESSIFMYNIPLENFQSAKNASVKRLSQLSQPPTNHDFVEAPPNDEVPPSELRQNLFMIFITMAQLVQMIPLGAGINSGIAIGAALGATPVQSIWINASYPLTQGSFVLVGGRLGAVYGHKNILTAACIWWVLWALCGGFANNLVAMCFMRGLCGIGGGLMIPNIIALIGITFPPGNKRNLGFGLFGAMAPVGAAGGSLVSAVVVQLTEFKWLFMML